MAVTTTGFGRNRLYLDDLERILENEEMPAHNALVIGAGLDLPPYSSCMRGTLFAENLSLQKYTWEPFEVAALLMRLGKPWTITVVDASAEVCNAVKSQAFVAVDDFYGQTEYARTFLQTFGVGEKASAREMAIINSRIEASFFTYRITVFGLVPVPHSVRQRIMVAHGQLHDLTKSALPNRAYNVVSCLNVYMHLNDNTQKLEASKALLDLVAEGGVVVTDFPVQGLQAVKPPEVHVDEDYDVEGIYRHEYKVYMLKKPAKPNQAVPKLEALATAQHPLAMP